MFPNDNFKFTNFLIKNKKVLKYTTRTLSRQNEIKTFRNCSYTLQDVYDQITVIVDSVAKLLKVKIMLLAIQ